MTAPSTAALSFLRLAATGSSSVTRSCSRCMRAFSSSGAFSSSSKRQLMTESAYRSPALDPPPAPPRNAVQDLSPASRYSWQSAASLKPSKAQAEYSIPEREVLRPPPGIPATQATGSLASPAPETPAATPRSRLRPRKAAMTLTPTAVERLREILDNPEPKLIRVGVKNKGCSGSAYHLEYVDKPGRFDEQVEQDGVKVLIDSKALLKVIGSEMDWVEDKLSARFTFRNPNVTEQCGCGESFSV